MHQQGREGHGVDEQGVLDAVVPGAQGGLAAHLGGDLQAEHGLVHGAVADDVERGLHPGGAAGGLDGNQVVRDLVGGQVQVPGPGRAVCVGQGAGERARRRVAGQVRVGAAHRGGARADRSVDVEVAADPGQERQLVQQGAGVVGACAQLAAVGGQVRQAQCARFGQGVGRDRCGAQGVQLGEAGAGVEVLAAHLVHGHDAAGGPRGQGLAVQAGAALGREGVRDVAHGVVQVGGDQAGVGGGVGPAGAGQAGAGPGGVALDAGTVGQGGGDDGGVHVDAGGVHGAAVARGVQLGARERTALGPGLFVPAEREQHLLAGRVGRRELAGAGVQGGQRVGQGVHAAGGREVHGVGGQAGLQDVGVRVDEPGGDQRAVQVDHAVGAGGEPGRGVVGSDPCHDAVVHEDRLGERVGSGVHDSVAVKDGSGGVAHGGNCKRSSGSVPWSGGDREHSHPLLTRGRRHRGAGPGWSQRLE